MLARAERTTLSELVRKGVRHVIKNKEKDPYAWLESVTGMFKGGPRDLSTRMNYYLYVEPYEKKKRKSTRSTLRPKGRSMLRVDTERRFLLRAKASSLTPPNVSKK